ncbi:bifunctional acetaldehyde-CoA/alcohol dehydrogenase, partial [Candidatus Gastranaerophilus sp. (ex Termes propinquus)]
MEHNDNNFARVTETQHLEELIGKVKKAQEVFATFSQEKVDEIFRAASLAANKARIQLAKMAVAETGMG